MTRRERDHLIALKKTTFIRLKKYLLENYDNYRGSRKDDQFVNEALDAKEGKK